MGLVSLRSEIAVSRRILGWLEALLYSRGGNV